MIALKSVIRMLPMIFTTETQRSLRKAKIVSRECLFYANKQSLRLNFLKLSLCVRQVFDAITLA